jgi:uncharacterized protein involved in type VI secretion and phage assembly
LQAEAKPFSSAPQEEGAAVDDVLPLEAAQLHVDDHHGEDEQPDVGAESARVRLEQQRRDARVAQGASACRRLLPGYTRSPAHRRSSRDALSVVAIEGRVAHAASTQELIAPLNGTPCVYYRVCIEQWAGGPQRPQVWLDMHDRSSNKPFVVADAAGGVLVDTVERDEAQWGDATGVDLDICPYVTRYESKREFKGFRRGCARTSTRCRRSSSHSETPHRSASPRWHGFDAWS